MTAETVVKNQPKLVDIIEDAQSDIRRIVMYGYLHNLNIHNRILAIIKAVVSKVSVEDLKKAVAKSLYAFANSINVKLRQNLGVDGTFLLLLANIANVPDNKAQEIVKKAPKMLQSKAEYVVNATELGEYSKDYMQNRVKPLIKELARQNALDPDDVSGRNSLRNRAEMEVRYKKHQDTIQGFKDKDVKLVISSVHSNCSKRCFPYQGKVYSLDGTSGVTEDGTKYEPLEVATQIPYVTKAGKVYMNGLLGFNCRHSLHKYNKDFEPPYVSEEMRKKRYEIDQTQRSYERNIRTYKTQAVMLAQIDKRQAKVAQSHAQRLYGEYTKFCRDNKVAINIERTKIF